VTTFGRKKGKHERLRRLLRNLCTTQPEPVLEDQLSSNNAVLGIGTAARAAKEGVANSVHEFDNGVYL
jgi:hypothetical protein